MKLFPELKTHIFFLVFFLFASVLNAQQQYQVSKDNPNHLENLNNENVLFLKPQEGHIKYAISTRDEKTELVDVDLTEVMDIIVEFNEEPLFISKKRHPETAVALSYYQNRFVEFSSNVVDIYQTLLKRMSVPLVQPEIKREFYKVFFGVSLKISRGALASIHNLPYVKKIHMNKRFEAFLDESVPLIRADSVWNLYGTQGDSIEVGILDTGIDYMHPAFGGGFGPGFKVFGGYDFVNNDDDPMDDVNHGTHVAGIVAADDDSIKGVAPHALLMAYKVISEYGFGMEEWILAAIETTVDPNGDGDFSDRLDVVNISFGSIEGDPDDAVSTAVDNAVEIGVVYCIAAGNLGDMGFSTVSSPGTARLAITVGASNKADNIALFSSKGPNKKIYSIKPEVIAPGVDINSTVLNGGYESMSGTSMSTPHVAGVSALLKAIHPDWTPAQIKSALMTSAIDIGEEVMVQGAGRIDALNAANTGVFAIPSHLSFGLDDMSLSLWVVSDTIFILNQSGVVQNYSISSGILPLGIELLAEPGFFTIADGDSQSVIVTLSVDNNVVTSPPAGTSLSYSGFIMIQSADQPLNIPWAFVKAPKVTLTFDQMFPSFFVYNDISLIAQWQTEMLDPYTFTFLTPPGNYDIKTDFYGDGFSTVIKENLMIDGFFNLAINSTEAIHTLEYAGVDEQGNLLTSLSGNDHSKNLFLIYPDSSTIDFEFYVSPASLSFQYSDVSDRYTMVPGEFHMVLGGEDDNTHVINHEFLMGLSGNVTLANSPSDFIMQNINTKYPPNAQFQQLAFANTLSWFHKGHTESFSAVSEWIPINVNEWNEWNGTVYITPRKHENFRFTTNPVAISETSPNPFLIYPWVSGDIFTIVGNDSLGCFADFKGEPSPDLYLQPDGGSMSFGFSPIYTNAAFVNNVMGESNIFPWDFMFYGAMNERQDVGILHSPYTLYNSDENIIAQGLMKDIMPFDITPGNYRFEVINSSYFVGSVPGTATLSARFDLNQADPDPPRLTSLKLLNSEGIPTERLETGETGTFMFSAGDFLYDMFEGHFDYQSIVTDSTKLYYKEYGTEIWSELSLTQLLEDTVTLFREPVGFLYTADFSGLTDYDSSATDIKIVVYDQSGNSTEWILEPAFAIGKFAPVTDFEQSNLNDDLPRAYMLHQNYPNPFNPTTTIKYQIPEVSFVNIKIFNILGSEVETIVNEKQPAGNYTLSYEAKGLSSGVYFYRITAGDFVQTKKMVLLK